MTFQFFIGLIIVTFAFNFYIATLTEGVVGMFLDSFNWRAIKVVVKNDGFNW